MKPASADVEVSKCSRCKYMVETSGNALATCILCTAIFAKTRTKRILCQAQHFPVTETSEHAILAADALVDARDIFIDISTCAGGLEEVVLRAAAGWIRNIVLHQKLGRGINGA